MNDYSYEIEQVLLRSLGTEDRGSYYGINADSANDTEGVWNMTWAVLTAHHFKNPDHAKIINTFLDENYDLNFENKIRRDWDNERMEIFLSDLKNLLDEIS